MLVVDRVTSKIGSNPTCGTRGWSIYSSYGASARSRVRAKEKAEGFIIRLATGVEL